MKINSFHLSFNWLFKISSKLYFIIGSHGEGGNNLYYYILNLFLFKVLYYLKSLCKVLLK